jgi:hypothetical protein
MADSTEEYLQQASSPLVLRVFPGHRLLLPFRSDGPAPSPGQVTIYLCECQRHLVVFYGLDEAVIVSSRPNARPTAFPRAACPCCGMTADEALTAARRHHSEAARVTASSE